MLGFDGRYDSLRLGWAERIISTVKAFISNKKLGTL